MASFSCPSCGRTLNLPGQAPGTMVQCPFCDHFFTAPAEGPLPWGPDEEGLDLREERERADPGIGPRNEAALHAAAFWLQAAILLDVVADTITCFSPGYVFPLFDLAILGVGVFQFLPLTFMAVGAWMLSRRWSYGLAQTGAIMAFVAVLCSLPLAVRNGLVGLARLDNAEFIGVIPLGAVLLNLLGAAAGAIGAIKALSVLSDSRVKKAFH
jgi:hypothetical protein